MNAAIVIPETVNGGAKPAIAPSSRESGASPRGVAANALGSNTVANASPQLTWKEVYSACTEEPGAGSEVAPRPETEAVTVPASASPKGPAVSVETTHIDLHQQLASPSRQASRISENEKERQGKVKLDFYQTLQSVPEQNVREARSAPRLATKASPHVQDHNLKLEKSAIGERTNMPATVLPEALPVLPEQVVVSPVQATSLEARVITFPPSVSTGEVAPGNGSTSLNAFPSVTADEGTPTPLMIPRARVTRDAHGTNPVQRVPDRRELAVADVESAASSNTQADIPSDEMGAHSSGNMKRINPIETTSSGPGPLDIKPEVRPQLAAAERTPNPLSDSTPRPAESPRRNMPAPARAPNMVEASRSGAIKEHVSTPRVIAAAVEARQFAPALQQAEESRMVHQNAGFATLLEPWKTSENSARTATEGPSPSAPKEAFAALDSGRLPPTSSWIHAGPHHAEAGYLDPSLGWVGVRADAAGTGVHAALVTGSAEAAQVLGGHLSGLNAYLAEHHGPQASVIMATPQGQATGLETNQGGTMGDSHGGHRNPSQAQGQFESRQPTVAATAPSTTGPQVEAPGPWMQRAGSRISVMA